MNRLAPIRDVVSSQVGPRSMRVKLPNGWAVLCGVTPRRRDTLSCGHVVEVWDHSRQRRRCYQCFAAEQQELPL